MSTIDQLLSTSAVPRSTMGEPARYQRWMDWFEEEAKKAACDEPWADSVRYDLNRDGYRCDEFNQSQGLKLMAVGCSYTFGTGIPYEGTFSYRVARVLEADLGVPVTNWNLSAPGKSADYIARMISSAVPVLKPHFVIVNFSHIARREFITETGRIIGYMPGTPKRTVREVMHSEAWELYEAFDKLASFPDDLRNFVLNFRLCEETVKRHDAVWCYSTIEEVASQRLAALHGDDDHIGGFLVSDGRAIDGSHPGPEPNRLFAESIVQHLSDSGKLEALKARIKGSA